MEKNAEGDIVGRGAGQNMDLHTPLPLLPTSPLPSSPFASSQCCHPHLIQPPCICGEIDGRKEEMTTILSTSLASPTPNSRLF